MRKTIDLHQMLHFDYNVSNFIEVYVSRIPLFSDRCLYAQIGINSDYIETFTK